MRGIKRVTTSIYDNFFLRRSLPLEYFLAYIKSFRSVTWNEYVGLQRAKTKVVKSLSLLPCNDVRNNFSDMRNFSEVVKCQNTMTQNGLYIEKDSISVLNVDI